MIILDSVSDILSAGSDKGTEDVVYDSCVEVVAETGDYIIINKPAGLLVHPTEAHEKETLVSWLVARYPEIKNVGDNPTQRPGIVHRLDREASGLLVVARTQEMFSILKEQFQNRTIEKIYTVLVYDKFDQPHGIIDFEIDRGKDGRMVSRPKIDKLKLKNVPKIQEGKESLTEYWVEKEFVRFSLLKVKIHTGRMHQIRVHMFACGHPVVGDTLYENKKFIKKKDHSWNRLFLHATSLCFSDLHGVKKCFNTELPQDLQNYVSTLTSV